MLAALPTVRPALFAVSPTLWPTALSFSVALVELPPLLRWLVDFVFVFDFELLLRRAFVAEDLDRFEVDFEPFERRERFEAVVSLL